MSDSLLDWSKDNFINFLLLHVAKSDFELSEEEIDIIKSRMSDSEFKEISKLHKNNSDYQNIQIIQNMAEKFCRTSESKNEIMSKVTDMVMADDVFNIHEKTMINALNMLLTVPESK